jgi:tungstate transport system permease protein
MDSGGEVVSAASLSLTISAVAVGIAAVLGVPLGALLGLARSRTGRVLRMAARVGMSFPTVLVGLLVYALLTRHGPLGGAGLLFTPQAIVAGEVLLAFPLIVALGDAGVASLDPRFRESAAALRLSPSRTALLAVSEAREAFTVALLTAFARCVTELGVALLVGGNFPGETRTLTTAIALETSRGDFERAARLGWVLVAFALVLNVAVVLLETRASGAKGRRP